MSETYPEDLVSDAMRPIVDLEVPPVLRASMDRHGRNLMGLASSLLNAGMDEEQVRTVIGQACASYRDELIAAILELRGRYER